MSADVTTAVDWHLSYYARFVQIYGYVDYYSHELG